MRIRAVAESENSTLKILSDQEFESKEAIIQWFNENIANLKRRTQELDAFGSLWFDFGDDSYVRYTVGQVTEGYSPGHSPCPTN
jgi:hypothetical protein